MPFNLTSPFVPTGDQPEAIQQLVEGVNHGEKNQVLLGVTGSGKTFTIANVIQRTQKPTLILSHNKTLVAQLYGEFKQFFPDNAVEYFVSYYDYYQPEAYIPSSDLFIEKDLSINPEVEKLRLATTSSLMTGRRDIIVVASVSCIYGLGNPNDYKDAIIRIQAGQVISRNAFLLNLVQSLYSRTETDLKGGTFRVRGYGEHRDPRSLSLLGLRAAQSPNPANLGVFASGASAASDRRYLRNQWQTQRQQQTAPLQGPSLRSFGQLPNR